MDDFERHDANTTKREMRNLLNEAKSARIKKNKHSLEKNPGKIAEKMHAPQPRDLSARTGHLSDNFDAEESVQSKLSAEDLEVSKHVNAKIKWRYLGPILSFKGEQKVSGARGGVGTKISEFVLDWEFLCEWLKVHAQDLCQLLKEINEAERKYHFYFGSDSKAEKNARDEFAKKCHYLAYMANFKRIHWVMDRMLSHQFVSKNQYDDFFYYLKVRNSEDQWEVRGGNEYE